MPLSALAVEVKNLTWAETWVDRKSAEQRRTVERIVCCSATGGGGRNQGAQSLSGAVAPQTWPTTTYRVLVSVLWCV